MDKLKEAGLTGLNISIDSFVPAKFDFITRRDNGLKLVLPNIERALETEFDSLKLNVVLMKGFNDDEILDFTRYALERDLELRFIEFMPFDDNNWSSDRMVKSADALAQIESEIALEPLEDGPNAVARTYGSKGYPGRIGFISSMSQAFCGGCNRIRVTADGNLKVCLFDGREVSLRDLMREGGSEQEISEFIDQAINKKMFSHLGAETLSKTKNRSMVRIGG